MRGVREEGLPGEVCVMGDSEERSVAVIFRAT